MIQSNFKVSEDKLDLSGLKGGLDFGYQKKWTYIWGDDDAEVARIKGIVDLNLADIVCSVLVLSNKDPIDLR